MTAPTRQANFTEREINDESYVMSLTGQGDVFWKDEVLDVIDLPTTGNTINDHRKVINDGFTRKRNGSAWVMASTVASVSSHLQEGPGIALGYNVGTDTLTIGLDILSLPVETSPDDNDMLVIWDDSDEVYKQMSRGDFLSGLGSSGGITPQGYRDQSTAVWPGGGLAQPFEAWIANGPTTTIDGQEIVSGDVVTALVPNASTTIYANNWLKFDNNDPFVQPGIDIQQPDSWYPSTANEYPGGGSAMKGQAWRALDADSAGSRYFSIDDIAVALVNNASVSSDADRAKIKGADVNLTLYVPAFTTATDSNQVAVSDSNGSRSIHFTPVRIDTSGNISSVALFSGQKMALTIDEAYPLGPAFYYTDFIQNGFTGSSPSTADMSNLFTGIYWKGSGTQTKNAGGYGLSGNQVFLRQQGTGKIDGAQALAPTVLFNNGRLGGEISAVKAFFSNRGTIDDAAYYRGEHNAYIGPEGTFTKLRGIHFKAGSLTGAAVVEGRGIDIDDDVPSVFAGSLEIGSIKSNGYSRHPIVTVTSNTSLGSTHYTVLVDATSGPITIDLPDLGVFEGTVYNIIKVDSSFNQVDVDGYSTQTVGGSATVSLITQYQSISIHGDASDWSIVGSHL